MAVYDDSAGRFQHAAGHWQPFVVRADFEFAHALGIGAPGVAPVVRAFVQVAIPVVTANGEIGNQVVQVRFVHHHHARMAERSLVDEVVVAVVAHLINGHVEAGGVERLIGAGENLQVGQMPERCGQRFGVIGDAAACRRHGREKGYAHFNARAPSTRFPPAVGA